MPENKLCYYCGEKIKLIGLYHNVEDERNRSEPDFDLHIQVIKNGI